MLICASNYCYCENNGEFEDITKSLRCIVCQNQSLYDSNSNFASNLKVEVMESLNKGFTKKEILTEIEERYGEFILYEPKMSNSNIILWLSPLLFLLVAAFLFIKQLKRK